MLILLSPAKKINLEAVKLPLEPTRPQMLEMTRELMGELKKMSVEDIQKLMKLSDNLAKLNYDRFQNFRLDNRSNSAKPAAFVFNGNVYEGLDALSMDKDALGFGQHNLRILSGLYGLLRPLDLIQPYRLEMGTRLKTRRGNNLYQFWGSLLAEKLNDELVEHRDKKIINLASNEYIKAVDKNVLSVPVIEAKFLNIKDGQARNLMYYAKKARGQMARWIMDEKIENYDDLRGFNIEGYKFDKNKSTDNLLVFSRKQPAPKKAA